MTAKPAAAALSMGDRKCLQAFRPGRLSLRSGKLLIACARQTARHSGDYPFEWAVRLFVAEQEQHHRFMAALTTAKGPSSQDDWRGALIDALPADVILRLVECRTRVAESCFSALAQRAEVPQLRNLYHLLATQQAGQLQFVSFAGARIKQDRASCLHSLIEPASTAVTVAIATRVWLRQRARLREAGHTFPGFVSGLLQPVAIRPLS